MIVVGDQIEIVRVLPQIVQFANMNVSGQNTTTVFKFVFNRGVFESGVGVRYAQTCVCKFALHRDAPITITM